VCPCTELGIRAAVSAGGGPYTFDCGGPQTVVTEAEIVISEDVVLDGGGDLVLDGNFGHRVLFVEESANAELRALQVIQGNDSTNRAGGILNDGTLTLTDSLVSMNAGGGLRNNGTATVAGSTISNNQGGGIRIEFQSTMTLTDCTVSGNVSDDFGEGGGIWSDGTLLSTGNTVSGNVAGIEGGGIYNSGMMTLVNTTVSGNAAGSLGGGIHSDDSTVDLTMINSTVANNSAPEGSAISSDLGALVTVAGTIVQGTCGGPGSFTSNGYNVESPGNTCAFMETTDQMSVTEAQLNLEPLQDNSGPTQTHALAAGSVALDEIPEPDCIDAAGDPLTVDQRGEPRPAATQCDVGAYELQP
ncbi:MAG: right-handed parallel beta-helix repeat-containing protein, partial [Polyangiales bacterium]